MSSMTSWQSQGFWEYEYNQYGYTGWYRFKGGASQYCEAYRTKHKEECNVPEHSS